MFAVWKQENAIFLSTYGQTKTKHHERSKKAKVRSQLSSRSSACTNEKAYDSTGTSQIPWR